MGILLPLNAESALALAFAEFDVELFHAVHDLDRTTLQIAAAILCKAGKRYVLHYQPEYGDGQGTIDMQRFATAIKQRKLLRRGERLVVEVLELTEV